MALLMLVVVAVAQFQVRQAADQALAAMAVTTVLPVLPGQLAKVPGAVAVAAAVERQLATPVVLDQAVQLELLTLIHTQLLHQLLDHLLIQILVATILIYGLLQVHLQFKDINEPLCKNRKWNSSASNCCRTRFY
jgi:hypothetical protein